MIALDQTTTMPGDAPVEEARGARRRRLIRRWIELLLAFGLAPWAISRGPRWLVLPTIVLGGLISFFVLLSDRTFPRRSLRDALALRRGIRRVLIRGVLACAVLLVFALETRGPSGLFHMPRTRMGVWLAVLIVYPFFSAYPQEIMYRALFFHRYSALFRRPRVRVVVNAALFGWAHVLVHNTTAMLLATAGGLFFASTYERSRSTLLVAVEHALYGDFVFTVGLGGMFTNSVRLLSKAIN